jgi:hypothetical protein
MRRFWSLAAALGLGLCVLAAAATGCEERRGRRVEVIRERPVHVVRVERERQVRVEPERHGQERDRGREREREHD